MSTSEAAGTCTSPRNGGRSEARAADEGKIIDALVEYWTKHFADASANPSSRVLAQWSLTEPVIRTVLELRGEVCEVMFTAVHTRAPTRVYTALDAECRALFEDAVNYLEYGLSAKMSALASAARGDECADAVLGPLHEAVVHFCIGLRSMGFSQKDLSTAVDSIQSTRKDFYSGARGVQGTAHGRSRHDVVRAFLTAVRAQSIQGDWPKLLPAMRLIDEACAKRLFECVVAAPHDVTMWRMVLCGSAAQGASEGASKGRSPQGSARCKGPALKASAALTLLSMLRFFDCKQANIFAKLHDGTTLLDMVQARARDDPSFGAVLAWMWAARHIGEETVIRTETVTGTTQARDRMGGNLGYPFSLAQSAATGTDVSQHAANRQAAADADDMAVCHACGNTSTEAAGPLLRCMGCRGASYCTKECQASDWVLGHRHICHRTP